MGLRMLKLDCRKWPGPMTTRALDFALGEFVAVVGFEPQVIVMRPDQHKEVEDEWEKKYPAGLFLQEFISDPEGRTAHFQMIPIHLR